MQTGSCGKGLAGLTDSNSSLLSDHYVTPFANAASAAPLTQPTDHPDILPALSASKLASTNVEDPTRLL